VRELHAADAPRSPQRGAGPRAECGWSLERRSRRSARSPARVRLRCLLLACAAATLGCDQNFSAAPPEEALAARKLRPFVVSGASDQGAEAHPAAGDTIRLGGLLGILPPGWIAAEPGSPMRRAELVVTDSAGAVEAVVAVFNFGPGTAANTAANIERWVAQCAAAGTGVPPRVEQRAWRARGIRITRVAIWGAEDTGAPAHAQGAVGHSMLGAIVEAPGGVFYVKLAGSAPVVRRSAGAFDLFLASLEPE